MTAIKDLVGGFGQISYGAITVGPLRKLKILNFEPVNDPTGRAVRYVRLTLHVLGTVYSDTIGGSAAAMDSLWEALSLPRQRLIVKDIGLPDIDTATTPDCNLGPRVKVLGIRPMGGYLAHTVEFEIEYAMPPPTSSAGDWKSGRLLGMNFDLSYTNNSEGLVERRISGFVDVLQLRGSEVNLETVYDRLNFISPDWMQRVSLERHFVAEKNKVEFSCVDVEFSDLAYPDGIIGCQADLELENRPPGFIQWSGQLSARMRTAPGIPRSFAANKFFVMMFDVADKLRQAAAPSKGIVIPERIKISASKFSRDSRFVVTWRMAACLHDILSKTGLWTPVPGTSYKSWRSSMNAAGVFGRRGVSNLRWGGQDVIIGLADSQPGTITFVPESGTKYQTETVVPGDMVCKDITKEQSYLHFANKIRGVQQQNIILHKLMQYIASPVAAAADDGLKALFSVPQQSARQDVPQYTALPDNLILMQGRALRIKYTPEIPKLESVAGVKVEELAKAVEVEPKAGYFDCPLIAAKWAVLYRVKGNLYGVVPPNNKQMCYTQGENDGRK